MSRTRRFFVDRPIEGDRAILTGAEALHALRVVRLQRGEEVRLFDGSGAEFRARLASGSRREAVFEVLSREEPDREPRPSVSVAAAVPRGPRADYLVEKCCELGAAEFIPLWCSRGVVDPRVRAESRLAKWRRAAVETSKQCGRTRLTAIREPMTFADLVRGVGGYDKAWLCLPETETVRPTDVARQGRYLVAIGPEGGFDEEETALGRRAGMVPLGLGPTVLRVETAAVVALARLLLP